MQSKTVAGAFADALAYPQTPPSYRLNCLVCKRGVERTASSPPCIMFNYDLDGKCRREAVEKRSGQLARDRRSTEPSAKIA